MVVVVVVDVVSAVNAVYCGVVRVLWNMCHLQSPPLYFCISHSGEMISSPFALRFVA